MTKQVIRGAGERLKVRSGISEKRLKVSLLIMRTIRREMRHSHSMRLASLFESKSSSLPVGVNQKGIVGNQGWG